jgi:hypothetical protein
VAIDSEARLQAEKEIVTHLAPLPRAAKRLVNRLRFVLHVSQRKALLGTCLRPEEIGKWSVLVERWPSLAWAINLDPGLLGTLELHSDSADGSLHDLVPEGVVPSTDDLEAFLKTGETRLAEAAEALVYLQCPGATV